VSGHRDHVEREWATARDTTRWVHALLSRHGRDLEVAAQLAEGLERAWDHRLHGYPRTYAERTAAEAAHGASLDDRTRRALAAAEAGGDGLGPGPSADVIAEARAALGRAA
jgi:hypothetical protein